MATNHEHEELVKSLYQQMKPVFEKSHQGIYLYLDDMHKICNKKYASLLGYSSPNEWASITESLLEVTVAKKSQDTLVSAYENAVEHFDASTIKVTWKKKSGGQVETTVILVPMIYDGHPFALHFVSQ